MRDVQTEDQDREALETLRFLSQKDLILLTRAMLLEELIGSIPGEDAREFLREKLRTVDAQVTKNVQRMNEWDAARENYRRSVR